jgi:hypothetical protein
MSAFDIFYLGLVLVAFAVFAIVLAYYAQHDRLPRRAPAETRRQAPAQPPASAKRVLEHA